MKAPKVSGIYAIYCPAERLLYIGSSNCIRVRWSRHKVLLHYGAHDNKALQSAYNRHSKKEGGIVFKVLESCCPHDLKRNEQLTILAAGLADNVEVANKNKSYSRSLGKITGKPIQSRLYNLNQFITD